MHTSRGFTLVEVLVSITIMLMLAVVIVSGFSNFRGYFALRAAVQDVHTALIDARAATLAAKNDTVHGVHFDTTQVVRFEGPTYATGTATNITLPFSNGITASTTLQGGGVDVVFTRLSGLSQKYGTTTLTEPHSGATSTILITSTGLIDI